VLNHNTKRRKMRVTATVAIVLAIVLLAPFERAANARGYGFGARSWYFALHHPYRTGTFRRVTPYSSSGFIVIPPYDGFIGYPETSSVPSCHLTQETVTVPSEEGGTRQITVTRCYRPNED
jgi:hypothetical protein